MANYTPHYQLHQWAPEDKFLRTDFNEDLNKIDTALGGMPKVVAGIYTGDGAASRIIPLGFTPKAVLVCDSAGHMAWDTPMAGIKCWYGGLALEGQPALATGNVATVTITENGFSVICKIDSNNSYHYLTNNKGVRYYYIAIK